MSVSYCHMLKRSLAAVTLALSLVVNGLGALPLPAQAAVVANTLIKIDGNPAVYWYANNNQRYAFVTPRVFNSWFTSSDLSRVLTVSPAELSSYPLGGSVTYRPGVRMVKVQTDPKVYAVSRYGTLRWVTSESIAVQLYGSNWGRQIDDISDDQFFNYQIGEPIVRADQYNVAFENGLARNPSDNIRPSGQTTPLPSSGALLNGQFSFSLSNTLPVVGGNVVLLANLSGTTNSPQDVSISFLSTNGETLYTCYSTLSCSYTWSVGSNQPGTSRSFFARARHANGQTRDSNISTIQVQSATGYNNQTSFPTISTNNASPTVGSLVILTAYANGNSAYPGTLSIIDATGRVYQSCTNVSTCTYSFTVTQQMASEMSQPNIAYSFSARFVQSNGANTVTSNPLHLYNEYSNNSPSIPGTNLAISFDRSSITPGGSFLVYATISPQTTNPPYYTIRIYDQFGALQHTCERVRLCTLQQTLSPTSDQTRSYYARAVADNGQVLNSTNVSIPVVQATTNATLGSTRVALIARASNGMTVNTPEVSVPSGSTITWSAAADPDPTNINGLVISIYNQDNVRLVACASTRACQTSLTLTNDMSSNKAFGFKARIQDVYGTYYELPYSYVTVLPAVQQTTTFSANIATTLSHPYSVKPGDNNTFTATVSNYNVLLENLVIGLYDEDGQTLGKCFAQASCSATNAYYTGIENRTVRVYANAWDNTQTRTGVQRSETQSFEVMH